MARVRTDARATVRAALVLEAFGYGGERSRGGTAGQRRARGRIADARDRDCRDARGRRDEGPSAALRVRAAKLLREVVSLGMTAPPTPPSPQTDAWRRVRREHDEANALAALCAARAAGPR